MPLYFGNWRNVELFSEQLYAAVLRGEMSYKHYRRRLKKLCAKYMEEASERLRNQAPQPETNSEKIVSPFATKGGHGR